MNGHGGAEGGTIDGSKSRHLHAAARTLHLVSRPIQMHIRHGIIHGDDAIGRGYKRGPDLGPDGAAVRAVRQDACTHTER